MENPEIITITPASLTNYAGFWRRALALVIDLIILSVPAYLLAVLLGEDPTAPSHTSEQMQYRNLSIYNAASFLLNWLYFAFMESSTRQGSLGKQAMGILVTDLEGNRISFGKATLRYFGKIVSGLTLFIGYLMAVFTQRRQALHDIIAGTLVLNKR